MYSTASSGIARLLAALDSLDSLPCLPTPAPFLSASGLLASLSYFLALLSRLFWSSALLRFSISKRTRRFPLRELQRGLEDGDSPGTAPLSDASSRDCGDARGDH